MARFQKISLPSFVISQPSRLATTHAPRFESTFLHIGDKMATRTSTGSFHENDSNNQSVYTISHCVTSSCSRSSIPPRAIDTHVHVFDPKLGPYAPGRAYTPEDAPLEELIAFNQNLSKIFENSTLVLVQPSPYENDCSVMMQCLQRLEDQNIDAFGIVVLDLDNVTDAELATMHTIGVRGIRLNLQADGKEVNIDKLVFALQKTADRICHLPGWIIQLFVPGWSWDHLYQTILDLPVPVIADHLGGMLGPSKLPSSLQSSSTLQPGFKSLLLLAKQSCVYVKISGLYRMSNEISSNFSDLELIVRTFSQEIPDQVIWGSDWPHTGEGKNRSKEKLEQKEAFRVIDNHVIMKQLQRWMGSDVYRKMLVDNPSCLYT